MTLFRHSERFRVIPSIAKNLSLARHSERFRVIPSIAKNLSLARHSEPIGEESRKNLQKLKIIKNSQKTKISHHTNLSIKD